MMSIVRKRPGVSQIVMVTIDLNPLWIHLSMCVALCSHKALLTNLFTVAGRHSSGEYVLAQTLGPARIPQLWLTLQNQKERVSLKEREFCSDWLWGLQRQFAFSPDGVQQRIFFFFWFCFMILNKVEVIASYLHTDTQKLALREELSLCSEKDLIQTLKEYGDRC